MCVCTPTYRIVVVSENDLYATTLFNRLYNLKVTLEIETLSERSGLRVCIGTPLPT